MKRFIGERMPIPLTPAVQSGNFLFLSGQVPTRSDGSIPDGIRAQTQLVLEKLAALLKEAGFRPGRRGQDDGVSARYEGLRRNERGLSHLLPRKPAGPLLRAGRGRNSS